LTAQAVVQALRALKARTMVVVTPYPRQVNDLMLDYFALHGLMTIKLAAFDAWGNGGIHNITPARIEQLMMDTAYAQADAVLASCTNLQAGGMVDRLEALTGKPVVTSNQATFWACARAAGVQAELPGLGQLGRR
jgi:arylmalonate decarboxylase